MPLVRLTARAEHDLSALPPGQRVRLLEALDRLGENPGLGKLLHGQLAGRRSLRVGNYRIIYRIAEDTVIVTSIGHRSDIYPQR